MRTEHETSRGDTSSILKKGYNRNRMEKNAPQNGPSGILKNTIDAYWETTAAAEATAAREDFDRTVTYTQPSSTPPTRTAILRGNGDTSELVIGGTTARPCSDEVCVSIVRRLFDSVAAMFLSNCWRSA